MVALMQNPDLHEYLMGQRGELLVLAIKRAMTLSHFSAHRARGQLDRTDVEGVLDGGSCVNLCSQAFIERAKLKMMPSSHQFGFTQVDATLTNEVGQCIDIPFELGGMSVPIPVVVLKNMDVDLILGMPVLEQSAKPDYATGCFCPLFN